MKRQLALATIATISATLAFAQQADELAEAFVGAPGWERQDVGAVDEKLLSAFDAGGAGAMRPDGGASPLEKALLLIETQEPRLDMVRTMLRYGQALDGDTPYSFVTVERYNLGPARRLQLIDEIGEENVATEEEFGIGPHVAWRIVTIPLMGNAAALIEASRREISGDEAAGADCLGRSCLDLTIVNDDMHNWSEADPVIDFASPYAERGPEGLARPARAAAELSATLGIAQGMGADYHWTGPEQPEAARGGEPFLFAMFDAGLAPEWAVDAVMGQTLLNDDSIAAIWRRRLEMEGAVYWFGAAEQR